MSTYHAYSPRLDRALVSDLSERSETPVSSILVPNRNLLTPVTMSTISLKIEFGGGLELLFSNQRSHRIAIPTLVPASPSPSDGTEVPTKPADITYLIFWLRDNLLKERAELFVENGTV